MEGALEAEGAEFLRIRKVDKLMRSRIVQATLFALDVPRSLPLIQRT
jgi:hypothetical protein